MTDLIERSAAIAKIREWFPGQSIDNPKFAAGKALIADLEAIPAARFTRADVEKAAIGMFNLRQGQRGTPNITFDQCVMLRDDWLALAKAALSAIGEVDHG